MAFYDGSASSIVGLVFIVVIGFSCFLLVFGCFLVRCVCPCRNLFWSPSRAQDVLSQVVQRKRLRVAAHRGGSIRDPENSMLAFQSAVRHGAGVLELDLNESKDGIPVVVHDRELERVVDPAWLRDHPDCKLVSDCYAADPSALPPLAKSIRLHFVSPTHTHYSAEFAKAAATAAATSLTGDVEVVPKRPQAKHDSDDDTAAKADKFEARGTNVDPPTHLHPLNRLCTLAELLDFAPRNIALHIDIKQPSKTLVRSVLQLLASHPRAAPTVILGSAGMENYHELVRKLGRNRGCKCGGTGTDEDPEQYCDEFMCYGCCVCCCCCFGSRNSHSAAVDVSAPSPLSSAAATTELLRDVNRQPLIFASFPQVVLTFLFFYLGVLPYVPLSYDLFSVPVPTTQMLAMFGRFVPSWAASLLYAPKLWSYLRSRGVVVLGWVLNSEKEFDEASQWPLDGIMTDDVPLLVSYFKSHPDVFTKNVTV